MEAEPASSAAAHGGGNRRSLLARCRAARALPPPLARAPPPYSRAAATACSRTAMLLARYHCSLLAAGDGRKERGQHGTVNAKTAASEGVAPVREQRPPRRAWREEASGSGREDGEGGVESMTRGPHMSPRWRSTPAWHGQTRSTPDKTASYTHRC